jgi:hypothetical protein
MCTVSYLPQPSGFVLTSNRDEAPGRSPVELSADTQQSYIFPKDTLAGGTWICASNTDRLICLLNGAFEKHQRNLPYRRSRGLVVLDAFEYSNIHDFFEQYNFAQIEPFTMVIVDQGNLFELRWDEVQTHLKQLDPQQAHIWSSSTLYPADVRQTRSAWFDAWLTQTPQAGRLDIFNFHNSAGADDTWNGLVMNRNDIVRTVSITSVEQHDGTWAMYYHDKMSGQDSSISLLINTVKPV